MFDCFRKKPSTRGYSWERVTLGTGRTELPRMARQSQCKCGAASRESPNQYRIYVSHPSEVTATAVRFRRQLIDLTTRFRKRASSAWFPLDAEIRRDEAIAFTVLLRSEDEKTELRRRVPLRLPVTSGGKGTGGRRFRHVQHLSYESYEPWSFDCRHLSRQFKESSGNSSRGDAG